MVNGQRLTDTACTQIVTAWKSGKTIRSIAQTFNIGDTTVQNLLSGRSYKGKYKVKDGENRAAGKRVTLCINNKEISYNSVRKLANFLGLSECHISNIIAGRESLPVITDIKFT